MDYVRIPWQELSRFCEDIFEKCGFTSEEAGEIVDVLMCADLYGIESHGVQRLIRYYSAITEGSIDPKATACLVHETPISRVYDAPRTMGQLVARRGMKEAIDMAKAHGIGAVCVRGSNHYGIAGYYTLMAAQEDLLGLCMTNTEAIAIPTYGRKAMLGTSPIALCMPADPTPFWYDAATTVVTRGKLEVCNKNENPQPLGWAADENGNPCSQAEKVLENIIGKKGGGIFPLGGSEELTGSHKGYGLGIIVELFTSVFAGGTTSPHVRNSGNADTSFCFWAVDYGVFGDKAEIRRRMSILLQELRDSPKAEGHDRIYTHGEKEAESKARIQAEGVPVNAKTLAEMHMIASKVGVDRSIYEHIG
ncbi:MAG: Ldh family oxidoreductase [Clostridiales bacterium]|nr:Ldh family oxidoreductase [Clostridiales bacterium]